MNLHPPHLYTKQNTHTHQLAKMFAHIFMLAVTLGCFVPLLVFCHAAIHKGV